MYYNVLLEQGPENQYWPEQHVLTFPSFEGAWLKHFFPLYIKSLILGQSSGRYSWGKKL